MRFRNTSFIVFLIGLLSLLGSVLLNRISADSLSSVAQKASAKMEEKSFFAEGRLDSLLNQGSFQNSARYEEDFQNQQVALYLFQRDSLVYWNNARVPLGGEWKAFKSTAGLAKLSVGYFLYLKKEKDHQTAIALCLIKPLYELQNNYLNNEFLGWTGIPGELQFQDVGRSPYAVNLHGNPLFSVRGSEPVYHTASNDLTCLILFLLGFLCLGLSILMQSVKELKSNRVWLLLAALLLLRFLMIVFHWPEFFYRTVFYDVHVFGNAGSYLNSYLGDILFNAITLAFMSLTISVHYARSTAKSNARHAFFVPGVLLGLVYIQYNQSVVSLVNNSTLSFDFLSVFNITLPEWLSLGSLVIYSLTMFVLTGRLIVLVKSNAAYRWYLVLLVVVICVVQHLISGTSSLAANDWLLVFVLSLYLLSLKFRINGSLALGVQVLIMSLVSSAFLNYYINQNEMQELDLLSLKLSEKQDGILESEFNGLPEKIAQDESLQNLISLLPGTEKEIEQKIKQGFFSGYFDRYEVSFSLFDASCNPLLPTKQAVLVDIGFFEEKIEHHADTISNHLFFVKDYSKSAQYIAKINIGQYNLCVLMEPKQYEELGSFPDLLLDRSLQKQDKLKNLSWVVYRNHQSTSRYGEFNYPYYLADSLNRAQAGNGFIHHYFKPDQNTGIILSQANKSWRYYFTFNSYVLLYFAIFTYLSYLLYITLIARQLNASSLTRRIQTIIILLLLLAMSAVGITSGSLVSRQFKANNHKQLAEKTEVILSELFTQFKSAELFEMNQKELLNLKLKEYSRLFNTPISLFGADGQLYTTSEPKLYELGLAAGRVNPSAYAGLTQNRAASVSVNEIAGTLNYMSYYTPLYGNNQQLNGFINLPYFARQGDLAKELSGIISALINVYVILFVFSILAGLILSGYITAPLRLIKQQIAKIALGKQNEKISWQSDDEIGKLVSEYNQMLVKLEESAGLLAQSERESAWREMAKQVAHEIKNPLTPMKLNLQYLQHLIKNNPDDFKERFERASAGIIEQIDSLAAIAGEFSNFAKLPSVQLQTVQLEELINSAIMLADDHKEIKIVNRLEGIDLQVKGDKDQCLRVLNNLIKNAVQALDGIPQPVIEITGEQKENTLVLSVKDNGCGIDEELKSRLFTPNFTTKSSGSGLGLAMAKNSMQAFGGNIWFESEKGKGTVFYLEFVRA